MMDEKANDLEFYRKINYECSNEAKIEVKLKFVEEERYLSLEFVYFPVDDFDSYLVLHWGINILSNNSSKWIQPPSCLFLSNGITPEKCEDGVSCDSRIIKLDNDLYCCQILFDIYHLKSSHEDTKINESSKGIESCENIIDWLKSDNKNWGISFVIYSISESNNSKSTCQKNWIKNKEKYSDFFIPIGLELFLLKWMKYIFKNDENSRNYIEYIFEKRKQKTDSNLKKYEAILSPNNSEIYNKFFIVNNSLNLNKSIIWVIANNIGKSKSSRFLTILFYADIFNETFIEEKKDLSSLKNDYEVILHFGFTKSIKKIEWTSPYIYLKASSCSLANNIDEKSSEVQFTKTGKYLYCKLEFCEEVLKTFEALVFVIKLKSKNKSCSSFKWIKSEHNKDFLFEIPLMNSYLCEKKYSIDSKINAKHVDLSELERLNKKNNDWKSNLQKFLSKSEIIEEKIIEKYSIEKDSIISNVVLNLSEDIGFLRAISFICNGRCIVILQTVSKRILTLHWGLLKASIKGKKEGWKCPPKNCQPINTIEINDKACETEMPLKKVVDEFIFKQEIEITIDTVEIEIYNKFVCVFRSVDEYGNMFWHKRGNKDIEVIISTKDLELNKSWNGAWSEFVQDIITAEVDWGSITLMHRYNLMHDIIQKWFHDFKKSDNYAIILNSSKILWLNFVIFKNEIDSIDSRLRNVSEKSAQEAILNGQDFWVWIMIWMRFNALGILDWQRNYNTAPRLLAHSAENASLSLISKWIELPEYRSQIRLVVQTVIRGGSRGQEVRDKILHIMHKNHIPELHGTFYEQWHQKLHNNTTPDDVAICRSIIAYLRSNGNEEVFLKVLTENGLSLERIAQYDRPITTKPFLPLGVDINSLAYDFEQYLEVLIDVHEALNLQRSLHYSRQYMTNELQNTCASIVFGDSKKFDDTNDLNILHERLICVSKAREEILNSIYYDHGGNSTIANGYNKYAIKEIMFLDLGLENLQSMFVQSMCTLSNKNINIKHLIDEMNSFLWVLFGHDPTNKELAVICYDWKNFEEKVNPSENYLLILKSILERLHIFIGNLIDQNYKNWDPKVKFFGKNIGLNNEDPRMKNFMDEILRSTLLSTISLQIKRINNYLCNAMNNYELQNWQFVSYDPSWKSDQKFTGIVRKMSRISDVEEDEYPKIVICSYISGEEDIPINTTAIILTNPEFSPDILSHLSIRARNMNVLLIVCQNNQIITDEIQPIKNDDIIQIKVINNMRIDIKKLDTLDKELFAKKPNFQLKVKQQSKLLDFKNKIKETNNSWLIYSNEMDNNKVGQKALNLIKLKKILSNNKKLPLFVPNCISLPFGTLSKLLNNSTREKIATKLDSLDDKDLSSEQVSDVLNCIRSTIEKEVEINNQLLEELGKGMKTLESCDLNDLKGKIQEVKINKEESKFNRNSKCTKLISEKIKQVWCSVYYPLAYNNMKKIGQSLSNVFMSVVVQRLINAKYAFVLHSKNPVQNLTEEMSIYDEMYGEVVIGLGETLVSNTYGKSMGFTARRLKNTRDYEDDKFIQNFNIISFPSKSIAMFDSYSLEKDYSDFQYKEISSNYIFRSDSNAEDIEGFAGAGVFQSVPLFNNSHKYIAYLNQPIILNEQYRNKIIKLLATVAFYIQDEFNNTPQDIEGCIIENNPYNEDFRIAIVQSRPQI